MKVKVKALNPKDADKAKNCQKFLNFVVNKFERETGGTVIAMEPLEYKEGGKITFLTKCPDCKDGQLILEITDENPYPDAVCDKCRGRIPFGLRRIKP